MKLAAATLTALLAASPALAQTAGSDSASNAQAVAISGGSGGAAYQAPGVGAPGLMHTSSCIVSAGMGISGPGFAITGGGGRADDKCNIRAEAAALFQLLGPRVAVEHLCKDADIRSTLQPLGYCTIHRSPVATTVSQRTSSQPAYVNCRFEAGAIRLSVRHGHSQEAATAQCRAALGY